MFLHKYKLKKTQFLNNLVFSVFGRQVIVNDFDFQLSAGKVINLFKEFGFNRLNLLFITPENFYSSRVSKLAYDLNQSFLGSKIVYGTLSSYFIFLRAEAKPRTYPRSSVGFFELGQKSSRMFLNFFNFVYFYNQFISSNTFWEFRKTRKKRRYATRLLQHRFRKVRQRKLLASMLFSSFNIRAIRYFKVNKQINFFQFLGLAKNFFQDYKIHPFILFFLLLNSSFVAPSPLNFRSKRFQKKKRLKLPDVIICFGSSLKLCHFLNEARSVGCLIVSFTTEERIIQLSDYSVYFPKAYRFVLKNLCFFLKKAYGDGIVKAHLKFLGGDFVVSGVKRMQNRIWRQVYLRQTLVNFINFNKSYIWGLLRLLSFQAFVMKFRALGYNITKRFGFKFFSWYNLLWVLNLSYPQKFKDLRNKQNLFFSFFLFFFTFTKKYFESKNLIEFVSRREQLIHDKYLLHISQRRQSKFLLRLYQRKARVFYREFFERRHYQLKHLEILFSHDEVLAKKIKWKRTKRKLKKNRRLRYFRPIPSRIFNFKKNINNESLEWNNFKVDSSIFYRMFKRTFAAKFRRNGVLVERPDLPGVHLDLRFMPQTPLLDFFIWLRIHNRIGLDRRFLVSNLKWRRPRVFKNFLKVLLKTNEFFKKFSVKALKQGVFFSPCLFTKPSSSFCRVGGVPYFVTRFVNDLVDYSGSRSEFRKKLIPFQVAFTFKYSHELLRIATNHTNAGFDKYCKKKKTHNPLAFLAKYAAPLYFFISFSGFNAVLQLFCRGGGFRGSLSEKNYVFTLFKFRKIKKSRLMERDELYPGYFSLGSFFFVRKKPQRFLHRVLPRLVSRKWFLFLKSKNVPFVYFYTPRFGFLYNTWPQFSRFRLNQRFFFFKRRLFFIKNTEPFYRLGAFQGSLVYQKRLNLMRTRLFLGPLRRSKKIKRKNQRFFRRFFFRRLRNYTF